MTTSLTSAKVDAPPLVSQRNAASRVVSLRVVFAAGSSDDDAGREGITSLTADMIAASGTKELEYAEVTKRLYPFAAGVSAHTDRDETVFEAEVASSSLESFYPLLRDILLTPRFDDESFSRLKSAAKSALTDDLRSSDDEALSKEALQVALYEGHPYGHPAVGTESGLEATTLADVRQQRMRVFCKERATVGISGGFPEGFDKTFAADMGKLPACQGARAALPEPKKKSGLKVLVIDKPSADATAIAMGFPLDVTRADADYPALVFFTSYLGLHRQSAGVLYQELREARGFNYGDYAYGEFFAQEGWDRYPLANIARRQQYASIWLRPVKPANAAFALKGALYFYRKQLESGVGDAELARFRTFLSRYVALEQQTESRRLGYALDDVTYGLKEPHLDRLRASWAALSSGKLADAARKHLTGKDLTVVIVSKDGEALKKVLVKGAATPPTYDAPKPPRVTDADKEIEKLDLGLADADVTVVPAASLFH